MKHGPFIFLGLLMALSLSWLGMVAAPQLQFGNQQPTNVPPINVTYPIPYSGVANLGRDVYRANGCASCHTQVIRQEGSVFDVVLSNPGTNRTAVAEALLHEKGNLLPADVEKLLSSTPVTVIAGVEKPVADAAQKALAAAGAEASVKLVPTGPDIARGWGTRVSVARDYLYDNPLMLGVVRLGPDLTNVGLRHADPIWHLVHLFNPKLQVDGSTMPRYPFLFQVRKPGPHRSSDALPIPGDEEVVPTRAARALAVYLAGLKTELPLFEAPGPRLALPPPPPGGTNQPAAQGGTNAPPSTPATNAPAAGPTAPP